MKDFAYKVATVGFIMSTIYYAHNDIKWATLICAGSIINATIDLSENPVMEFEEAVGRVCLYALCVSITGITMFVLGKLSIRFSIIPMIVTILSAIIMFKRSEQ